MITMFPMLEDTLN